MPGLNRHGMPAEFFRGLPGTYRFHYKLRELSLTGVKNKNKGLIRIQKGGDSMNFSRLQKTDAMVAIYILVAFIMLIVPFPAVLLDVFMALNMALAFTILFVCMFSKEVLDRKSVV